MWEEQAEKCDREDEIGAIELRRYEKKNVEV